MNLLDELKQKSLTVKIAATSVTVTILVVVILGGVFVAHQKKQIYADLTKRGISLAKIAAHNGVHGVLDADSAVLRRLVRGVATEEDVAYVIVEDIRGNVLAKTETGLEENALGASMVKKAVANASVELREWEPAGSPRVYEFAAPILVAANDKGPAGPEHSVGTVRVGITTATAESAIMNSIKLLTALTTVLVVLSMLATTRTMKMILSPLRTLLTCVQSTGEGDLTKNFTVADTNDEVGELGKAFGQMQESLNNMVRQIRGSAELVDASVSDLSSSSKQQAAGATEQSTSLTETSSAVEELAAVSKQIAENAKTVAQMAEQSLDRMETIRESTSQGANRILALGEKSQSIGEVVGMIDDITRQTNLLALNASIEAARAGAAGKGFAVVATEIRKLATNVAGSTEQIREIIKEIQDATNASVLATENITSSVESGIEMSKLAAESAAHINMATQQQKSASDQMVTTIKEMVAIAQQTSSGARQIAETANKLSGATKDQRKLVAQFRIKQDA